MSDSCRWLTQEWKDSSLLEETQAVRLILCEPDLLIFRLALFAFPFSLAYKIAGQHPTTSDEYAFCKSRSDQFGTCWPLLGQGVHHTSIQTPSCREKKVSTLSAYDWTGSHLSGFVQAVYFLPFSFGDVGRLFHISPFWTSTGLQYIRFSRVHFWWIVTSTVLE